MAKPTIYERLGSLLDTVESRWSLAVNLVAAVASFGLPAWATHSAQIFSEYAPLSWVVAGFLGIIVWALFRLIWSWGLRIRVYAKYDERFLEHDRTFNPLDNTFERKRIFVNEFVLPSHPLVDGKTFIDCDIIGPANIYFAFGNQINPLRPPIIDAICLDPNKYFNSGFTFWNCIFRNCSFQRITAFVSADTFEQWKDSPSVNWIGVEPSPAQIAERKDKVAATLAQGQQPKQIEDKRHPNGGYISSSLIPSNSSAASVARKNVAGNVPRASLLAMLASVSARPCFLSRLASSS